jgi:hypothetical protein
VINQSTLLYSQHSKSLRPSCGTRVHQPLHRSLLCLFPPAGFFPLHSSMKSVRKKKTNDNSTSRLATSVPTYKINLHIGED